MKNFWIVLTFILLIPLTSMSQSIMMGGGSGEALFRKRTYNVKGSVAKAVFPSPVIIHALDTTGREVTSVFLEKNLSFKVPLTAAGRYKIVIDAQGYALSMHEVSLSREDREVDLGKIELIVSERIEELVVSAKQTYVRNIPEGYIYDVLSDPDSKKLKMNEFFGKLPGVRQNAASGDLVYGDDKKYLILVDGRKHSMISKSKQFPMTMIQADHMKSIEVWEPAPPEYEDEDVDVVINIVLAKELPNGFMGQMRVSGNNQNEYNANLNFTFKVNKLIFDAGYGLSTNDSPVRTRGEERENFLSEENRYYSSMSESYNYRRSDSYSFGASYDFNSKNIISLLLRTSDGSSSSHSNSHIGNRDHEGQPILQYSTFGNSRNKTVPKLGGAVDYVHYTENGSQLTLSYGINNSASQIDYHNRRIFDIPADRDPVYTLSTENTASLEHRGMASFRWKLDSKNTLSSSLAYTNRHYTNDSEYFSLEEGDMLHDPDRYRGLDYTQQVYSFIVRYIYRKQSWSFTLMPKAEYVINSGEFKGARPAPLSYENFAFQPFASVSYMTKKRTRFAVNYHTRAVRPGVTMLNPFWDDTNPQHIQTGNPQLKPEYGHYINIWCMKKLKKIPLEFAPGLEYNYIDKPIERYTMTDENNTSVSSYRNIGYRENYAVRLAISLFTRRVTVSDAIYYKWNIYYTPDGGRRMAEGFTNNLMLYVNLWRGAEFFGMIKTSGLPSYAQEQRSSVNTSWDFSLSQALVKNKLYASLSVRDPFRNHKYKTSDIVDETFFSTVRQEQTGRIIRGTIRWNFGRLKARLREAGSQLGSDDMARPTE